MLKITADAVCKIVRKYLSAVKQVILPESVPAGGSTTLCDTGATPLKFAIVKFLGDGESYIRYDITIGGVTRSIYANVSGIEVVANQTLKIDAVNTDTAKAHSTGTIEIVFLDIVI